MLVSKVITRLSANPPVTALASLRELKEDYSDKATIARRETGRLDARLGIVERDCQDCYAEATKVFVEGTEIGDLIRIQVPTTGDYNPPTAGAGTPPPSPAPQ